LLPYQIKRSIYTRLLPAPIFDQFDLSPQLYDEQQRDLVQLECTPGTTIAEMAVYHQIGFEDPIVYGQIMDTVNGQIHILLYVISDPNSPRFDVDRMPDGSPTEFGVIQRNIPAEIAAMEYGLAPGQVRSGLRMMRPAAEAFEDFAILLSHDRYFAEPLYYHNAVLLERAGFAYLRGRRQMETLDAQFAPGGALRKKLDGSTPFRQPHAADHIRLRSWALHDGIAGQPYTGVTMYKIIGKDAGIKSTADLNW
jgi:hypothetical protein